MPAAKKPAKKPATKAQHKTRSGQPATRVTVNNNAPNNTPAASPNNGKNSSSNTPPSRVIRNVTTAPSQFRQPLEVRGSGTVKLEFMVGLVLIVLAPMADSTIKMDKNYVRHIVAWMLVFMFLFPMSGSRNAGIVRLANGMGGLLLLVIAVKGSNSGFGVNIAKLLQTIVAKIQPGGSSNPNGPGSQLGGPVNGG